MMLESSAAFATSDCRGGGQPPARDRAYQENASTVTDFTEGVSREEGVVPAITEIVTAPGCEDGGRSLFSKVVRDVRERIQFLCVEAEIDHVPFSVGSYDDFVSFLLEVQPNVCPALFLHDDGNLRALWCNKDREQVGLKFLGDGNVQFVIFKRPSKDDQMVDVAGTDAKPNIMAHIKARGALGLLIA